MSARRTHPDCATCRRSRRCAAILSAVLAETSTPVLVKIAPDLADTDIDDIADLAVELGLAGIVATNTTVSREGLRTPGVDQLGSGGISGPPLTHRAGEVLRRLYGRVGDRLALISVGGIETVDDAWDRITAGASLLQGYTGFIYGGGLWAKHIHDGLADRLRARRLHVVERRGRIGVPLAVPPPNREPTRSSAARRSHGSRLARSHAERG